MWREQDNLRTPLWLWPLASVLITGCFSSDHGQAYVRHEPTGHAASDGNSIPWKELAGSWQGTSYRDRMGIFYSTPPLARDDQGRPARRRDAEKEWTATIDVLFEVDEKHLSIRGVETGWMTFSYNTSSSRQESDRNFYRMKPIDGENPNRPKLQLRGKEGDFELTLVDDKLHLKGTVRSIGDISVLRQIHVTLSRSEITGAVDALFRNSPDRSSRKTLTADSADYST